MSRYAMCPECGRRLRKIGDGEYYCPYCDDYDDDMPECCVSCGGNYPECTTSCPLVDD